MIRVGFVFHAGGQHWLGGANYVRNLLRVLRKLPNPRVHPVLLLGTKTEAPEVAGLEIIRTRTLDRLSPAWAMRRLVRAPLGRDLLWDRWLARQGISVLSHDGHLGPHARTRTLSWIPDFQHVRLPNFFPEKARLERDQAYRAMCRHSSAVIVSSEDARQDLARFAPEYAAKARVLRFAVDVPPFAELRDADSLRSTYGFTGAYFHLPNQFWAHKNHRVVIGALRELKARFTEMQVICTGNPKDFRNPLYFDELVSYARESGVDGMFRVLGIVPYLDMLSLMRYAVAVINPSLFEGWSTTVEEAKSLGKRVILSSIPVHQEQAPRGGVFFDPAASASLAEAMAQVWETRDAAPDLAGAGLEREGERRRQEFGRAFEEIVLGVTGQG